MPNIGPLEIAIVLIIALLVFGPKRLPDLGRSLGRGITEFRDGLSSIGDKVDDVADLPDEDSSEEPEQISLGPGEVAVDTLATDDPVVAEITVPSGEVADAEAQHPDPLENGKESNHP